MKTILSSFFAAAVLALPAARAADAAAPAAFTLAERKVLQALAADVSAALRESAVPADAPVAILPLGGDRGDYALSLLKNAVTDAGRVCVEGRDDPMFVSICDEIGWSVLKERYGELDPSAMTAFGKLKSVRVLLYGRLDVFKNAKGRLEAVEINLHASEIETRKHVWGKTFRRDRKSRDHDGDEVRAVPASPLPSDLFVYVSARPDDEDSSDLALELLSVSRERFGGNGFRLVLEPDEADVSVQLKVGKTVFDRTGNYAVMEGSVRALAVVPARKGFYLGETRIDRERGERRLGDRDAMLSVRDAIAPKLVSWIGENVTVAKVGLEAVRIACDVSEMDEDEVAAFAARFVAAAEPLDGVARCRVVSQTPDEVAFEAAYQPDKFPEGFLNALRVKNPGLLPERGPEL